MCWKKVCAAPLLTFALSATAAEPEVWRFDVPAQAAASGIAAFSRQAATVQILVSQDAVATRRTSGLKGAYPIESALTLLLRSSGLRWLKTGPATYSIVPVDYLPASTTVRPGGALPPGRHAHPDASR
ncbi:STN domain-containing protein [Xanthomonas campestris]|uniref:STN domain-containing protein n=1 Tax=Xanthomonas campestris TaxID=339 RepID=UPI002359C122|nr:STN domain-containing protein [Xanthomonas campestris]MDC8748230.1 STN domain-containing protein [Xanthomonas campestris]